MNDGSNEDWLRLSQGRGFVTIAGWYVLELTGADRCKYLHNFCTADVNRLGVNATTEAFVLNQKSKTMAHGHVISYEDRLLFAGPGSEVDALVQHLDKYIILEDVQLKDRTSERTILFVPASGEEALARAGAVGLEPGQAKVGSDQFDGVHFANVEVAGQGIILICENELAEAIKQQLVSNGLEEVHCKRSFHAFRLQHGSPWHGIEISDSNLPQEIDRDAKAISFTKGCYLGQETVARIDALGQVNKLLRKVISSVDGEIPECPAPLMVDDKEVGQLLAAELVPGTNEAVGSVMVKRDFSGAGTELTCEGLTLTVA